jgi:hypothetical protein
MPDSLRPGYGPRKGLPRRDCGAVPRPLGRWLVRPRPMATGGKRDKVTNAHEALHARGSVRDARWMRT